MPGFCSLHPRSCLSAGLCEAGHEVLPKYLGKTKGFLMSLCSPSLPAVLLMDPAPQIPEIFWLTEVYHTGQKPNACSVACPVPSLPVGSDCSP